MKTPMTILAAFLIGQLALQGEPQRIDEPAEGKAREVNDLRQVFAYMTLPITNFELRYVPAPGLARLFVDSRGKVTSVKVLKSTGNRLFDAEAADTLARWRTHPGIRQVDIPLNLVITGPRRVIDIEG
ncbi:MAG: energy transducer TonB [Chthoniobacterales bacterium]